MSSKDQSNNHDCNYYDKENDNRGNHTNQSRGRYVWVVGDGKNHCNEGGKGWWIACTLGVVSKDSCCYRAWSLWTFRQGRFREVNLSHSRTVAEILGGGTSSRKLKHIDSSTHTPHRHAPAHVHTCLHHIHAQINPFPLKPVLQTQSKLPTVLLHRAFTSQEAVPTAHSSISVWKSDEIGN